MSATVSAKRSSRGYATGDVASYGRGFGDFSRGCRSIRERVRQRLVLSVSGSRLPAVSVRRLCSAACRDGPPLVSNLLCTKACLFMNSPGLNGDFLVTRLTCRVDAKAPL